VAVLAVLAGPPAVASAQSCDVRYTARDLPGATNLSLSAGEVWAGNVPFLTSVENTGRNDVLIETQGVQAGAAVVQSRLIAVDGQTAITNPIAFGTVRLLRFECGEYATVYDALDLMEELGGSAPQLVADAQAQAEAGVAQAQASATAIFDVSMEALAESAETTHEAAAAAWADFELQADQMMQAGSATLEDRFPELHAAMSATADYAVGVPASTVEAWQAQQDARLQAFHDFDEALGASATMAALQQVDPADHFPAFAALEGVSCPVDPAAFEYQAEALGRTVQPIRDAAAFVFPEKAVRPLMNDLSGVLGRMLQGPCDEIDAEALAGSVSRDLEELRRYFEEADRVLAQVDVRALSRGQEAFGDGVQDLAQTTRRLLQALIDQNQLEEAAKFRKAELDEAYERFAGMSDPLTYEGPGSARELAAGAEYWERRARQADPETLEAEADAVVEATVRYEAALKARESGWLQIVDEVSRWSKDAGDLAGLVPRLDIRVRGAEALVRTLGDVPTPVTPGESLGQLADCVGEAVGRLRNELVALTRIRDEILGLVADAIDRLGPPEGLDDQLQRAIDADLAWTAANRVHRDAVLAMAGQVGRVAGAVAGLTATLAGDAAAPQYMDGVEQSLEGVRTEADELADARARVDGAWRESGERGEEFAAEIGRLIDMLAPDVRFEAPVTDLTVIRQNLADELEAIGATNASIGECAGEVAGRTAAAVGDFAKGLDGYAQAVGFVLTEAGAALLSRELEAALAAHGENLHAQQAGLVRVGEALAGLGEYVSVLQAANEELNPVLVGADWGTLPDRMAAVEEAARDAGDAGTELRDAIADLMNVQGQVSRTADGVVAALLAWGGDAVFEGGEILVGSADAEAMAREAGEVGRLAGLWATAVAATPGRLAEQVGVDEELLQQGRELLAEMQTELGRIQQCTADGIAARATLGADSYAEDAVAQAMGSMADDAQTLFADLQTLLDPLSGGLPEVGTVLEAGDSLMERVYDVFNASVAEFDQSVAYFRDQASEAAQCVADGEGRMSDHAAAIQSLASATGN
jgi:hypothetical protein